jgi:hypothetical protein
MGAVAEGLVGGVTAAAEASNWTLVRNLVPFHIKNGEVALYA